MSDIRHKALFKSVYAKQVQTWIHFYNYLWNSHYIPESTGKRLGESTI